MDASGSQEREPTKTRRVLWWSVAAFAFLFLCWNTVWFGGASGQIVDESSGRPLKDVVVVATWTLRRSISGGYVGHAEVQETRTDANGAFRLPAWGPRVRLRGSIYQIDPKIRAFRPGYLPLEEYGVGTILGKAPVLRMQSASDMEYRKLFDQFLGEVATHFFSSPFECDWQHIPQLIAALQAEARILGDGSLKTFDLIAGRERVVCGQ